MRLGVAFAHIKAVRILPTAIGGKLNFVPAAKHTLGFCRCQNLAPYACTATRIVHHKFLYFGDPAAVMQQQLCMNAQKSDWLASLFRQ